MTKAERQRQLWADPVHRAKMIEAFRRAYVARSLAQLAGYRARRDRIWAGELDRVLRALVAARAPQKILEFKLGFSISAIKRRKADLGL